jgi:hypothetical protein
MVLPVSAGGILLASDINAIINTAWTNYTPTITASGGGFSLGNGSVTGEYHRVSGSNKVRVHIKFTCGSTTSFGAGYMQFTNPVNATADAVTYTVGKSFINDVSAQARPGSARLESVGIIIADNSGGVVTGTSPMTWANTDTMTIDIEYEV